MRAASAQVLADRGVLVAQRQTYIGARGPAHRAGSTGSLLSRQGVEGMCLRQQRSWQGLLTTASKAPGGGYGYNTASVPLLAEALKLAVSAWLLARQRRTAPELARTTRSLRGAALFVVPSIIYWLHNNVQARPWCTRHRAAQHWLGCLKLFIGSGR